MLEVSLELANSIKEGNYALLLNYDDVAYFRTGIE